MQWLRMINLKGRGSNIVSYLMALSKYFPGETPRKEKLQLLQPDCRLEPESFPILNRATDNTESVGVLEM
jgi:hypothetical protein